jgi:hypothetical protein
MLSPTKVRLATLVLGSALLGVACGESNELGTETPPFQPIVTPDSTAPVVPASDAGTLPVIEAGPAPVLDAGPRLDATPSVPSDASVDTATPVQGDASTPDATSTGSDAGPTAPGSCCPDGKCLCHGPEPKALTSSKGPYKTASYTIAGTGCVFYPTDAEAPFAAVAVADGFLGAGGCGSFQTGEWGPLYASWGIVAMIVDTGSSDQPDQRSTALLKGIAAFKTENTKSGGPLNGKLAGRYGTSGFSMGGGGTTIAASKDKTLLSDVALMPWGPANSGITVPTLIVCGSSDNTAPCAQHGTPAYKGIAAGVPKMRIQINSGHAGQPSSGMGKSGQVGLAFQKVFLEGDLRWRPLLVAAQSEETTIK